MRVAPVGLFMQSPEILGIIPGDEIDEATFRLGCDVGALTHGHPSGYLPSGCLALLLARAIDGDELHEAINCVKAYLASYEGHCETMAAIDQAISLATDHTLSPSPEAVARLGEGWVGEEAFAIALYCAFVSAGDFDAAIHLAVNHSGDSDSTGAIAGHILGAFLGRGAIEEQWLAQLECREIIKQTARDLFNA
jgi:ADP-ribosylglycohydrolase